MRAAVPNSIAATVGACLVTALRTGRTATGAGSVVVVLAGGFEVVVTAATPLTFTKGAAVVVGAIVATAL